MKNNKSMKMINYQATCVSKPNFANLPGDLVSEILFLLPVKSLTRFKCVCKSWQNLISHPKFIKNHLQKSKIFNNKLIFSNQSNIQGSCYHVKSLPLDMNDKSNDVSLDFPIEDRRSSFMIVGSCNGLVCLGVDRVGFLIWNPSTGLSNKLPHSSRDSDTVKFQRYRCELYGFGYDPLNDDYKVAYIKNDNCLGDNEEWVEVYSIKSNSWKIIGDFPHKINPIDNRGEYFNGVIHWMLKPARGCNSTIVSLNLGNETYGKIPQPYYGDCKFTSVHLGILEGCLSIFCHFFEPDTKTDIWIMQEYGVRETWTKLYNIQFCQGIGLVNCFLICIFTTGEMLFNSYQNLVVYDPAKASLRSAKIGNLCGPFNDLSVFHYVESLVSPQH